MLNDSHLSQMLVWMHNLRRINSACSSNGRMLLRIKSVKTFSWNNCLPASLQQDRCSDAAPEREPGECGTVVWGFMDSPTHSRNTSLGCLPNPLKSTARALC